MVRRLATLAVLLLSLSGVVPAALACADFAQDRDCCPPGQPCETQGIPTFLASNSVSCCDLQPLAQQVVVAVSSKAESQPADASPPDHCAAPALEISGARSPPFVPITIVGADNLYPDQQQTYLLTGRLRL